MKKESYKEAVIGQIPRLLSLIDANPESLTYGCADRQYWKYKITDFSNARMQEAALTLALAYKQTSDNRLEKLAEAAVGFWTKIQNKNGSFNEYMPKESSHVATAFSAFAVAEALRALGLKDQKAISALKKAGTWLSKHTDIDVANHDAGAAAALVSIYKLTGDATFLKHARDKMRLVLNLQDKEGWFKEYGGADIGYQSFSIYYLAHYWKETNDSNVLEALKKAVDFFSYFIHPDFSVGGLYGNRETNLVLPAGFETMAGKIKLCSPILDAISRGMENGRLPSPRVFDDRFLSEALYPFMVSMKAGKSDAKLPKDTEFRKVFENAGLFVQNKGKTFIVVNMAKGGVFNIFYDSKAVFKDSGWISGDITTAGRSTFKIIDNTIVVSGKLTKIRKMMQDTKKLMAIRTVNYMGMNPLVKSMARKHLIKKEKVTGTGFSRKIKVMGDNIEIYDEFDKGIRDPVLTSRFHHVFSTSTGFYIDDVENRIELSGDVKQVTIKVSKGKVKVIK